MIVRLNGGLGNTLFQWAFGRSVGLVRGEEVSYETKWMGRGETRAYSLGAFDMDVQFGDSHGRPEYVEKQPNIYDPEVYIAPPSSFFIGNWQTSKYFNEPIIRKELTLRNPVNDETQRVAEEILAGPSAFVHVRRGDYTDAGVQQLLALQGPDYYLHAMKYVQERVPNVRFFAFSDEPNWCQANLNCRVVSHNGVGNGDTGPSTEHEDLWLMSLCDHAVIPNSTFGWWGAWWGEVRKPRIVVAPQKWFNNPNYSARDIVPTHWIKL